MHTSSQPGRANQGYFPINVKLADRPVLVVGGGRTALTEARRLVDFGARVDVVAPNMVVEPQELGVTHSHRVTLHRRDFSLADEDNLSKRAYVMAFACSGQYDQDDYIAKLANDAGVLCCIPDNHEPTNNASFLVPAIRKRGLLRIAVSTDGYSQALAKSLLERIEASLGGRIDKYMLSAKAISERIAALYSNDQLTDDDRRQVLRRLAESEEIILAFQRENFEEAMQLVDMVISETRDPAAI
jgi:siroheme synthase-like protein